MTDDKPIDIAAAQSKASDFLIYWEPRLLLHSHHGQHSEFEASINALQGLIQKGTAPDSHAIDYLMQAIEQERILQTEKGEEIADKTKHAVLSRKELFEWGANSLRRHLLDHPQSPLALKEGALPGPIYVPDELVERAKELNSQKAQSGQYDTREYEAFKREIKRYLIENDLSDMIDTLRRATGLTYAQSFTGNAETCLGAIGLLRGVKEDLGMATGR